MTRTREFQYTSSKRDMRVIYQRMWEMRDKIDWPAVMVCDTLQDGEKIERHITPEGLDIIYLANHLDDEVSFKVLIDEVVSPSAPEHPTEMYFNLTSKEVATWYYLASLISQVLEIECPQIFFVPNLRDDDVKMEGASFTGCGLTLVCDYGMNNFYDMALSLAHELRHEWQFYNKPKMLLEYVPGKDNIDAYYQHPSEIDAEAFARKFVDMIWGTNFSDEASMENYENVRERQAEIEFDVDWNMTQVLYELLDDEL